MLNSLWLQVPLSPPSAFAEGDLYKIITAHGRTFPIHYGYYEECDRDNPAIEPMPIYPDFLKSPQYTEEGAPFVTKMQDICSYYKGKESTENDCADCAYYRHGDELIGICTHPANNRNQEEWK